MAARKAGLRMSRWLLEWQDLPCPLCFGKGSTRGVPIARAGGRGPVGGHPCCSPPTPHPADPAPVLEAARSLEDRLQQLQRLEPEPPPPLKDLSRPWKKHPELASTKGTRWGRAASAEHPWNAGCVPGAVPWPHRCCPLRSRVTVSPRRAQGGEIARGRAPAPRHRRQSAGHRHPAAQN